MPCSCAAVWTPAVYTYIRCPVKKQFSSVFRHEIDLCGKAIVHACFDACTTLRLCPAFSPRGRSHLPPLPPYRRCCYRFVPLAAQSGWAIEPAGVRDETSPCTLSYTSCVRFHGVPAGERFLTTYIHPRVYVPCAPINRVHVPLVYPSRVFFRSCITWRERVTRSVPTSHDTPQNPRLFFTFFSCSCDRARVCGPRSSVRDPVLHREANWLDLEGNRHQDYFRRQEKKEKAMYGVGRGQKFNASRQRHDVIERVRMRRETRLKRDRERRPAERNAANDELCSIS